MKKILGLDLGSSSIGWAFITQNETGYIINRLGVRTIPLSVDEKNEFTQGQTISVNRDRTIKRTARKTVYRYKQRRTNLVKLLTSLNILPSQDLMIKTTALELYGLRARAASERIELDQFARLLLLLNQKRGYKSSRVGSDTEESGKKVSDYLQDLKDRKDLITNKGITIGEYFRSELTLNRHFRIKKNVFPRECYIDEFNTIWDTQSKYYPTMLTNELKASIRDSIIFYQRALKSQKHLVGECRFEKKHKVAPKSSPLFQVGKIWESINAITLTNKRKENFVVSREQKLAIFHHLDNNERLTQTDLLKILGLKRTDGWHPNEQIKKSGLQGNITKCMLLSVFKKLNIKGIENHLQFDIWEEKVNVDTATGEVITTHVIKPDFEKQPLYQLWHVLYSIPDPKQVQTLLARKFHFNETESDALAKLDFKTAGFGNKSAKAIRKILPGLIQGMTYDKAAEVAGYKHSDSLTTDENLKRELSSSLEQYRKNSLRQPVVEKVLNQLVNLVNAITQDEQLGRPDEIRIELARELRQSRDERNQTYTQNNQTDKRHKEIQQRIQTEFPGLSVTRKVLEKYKLFEQQGGLCIYSGKSMELSKVLVGDTIDVDHIIPQAKLFDDSFQNKVLTFRNENARKSNASAFDYQQSKSSDEFNAYLERVDLLFEEKRITRAKRERLLMAEKDIPNDFINRQLNETRYISKEAKKLLSGICYNVYATSGSVTDFLRNQWGYNEVLKQLNWNKYEAAGKIEDGKILDWSKRDDHRHHAIDALVVAATQQRIIQQLNLLNSTTVRQEMLEAIKGRTEEGWQSRKSLLEQYVQVERPFHTEEVKSAISKILISTKPGKKVATLSKNPANHQKTFTPRGQLHKEQVYGKIRRYNPVKTPLNGRFTLEKAALIANPKEKELVLKRLAEFNNDAKKAFSKLDSSPIWTDVNQTKALEAVTLWEDHFVYKYTLNQSFKEAKIESIVDEQVKRKVRERFDSKRGQKDHPLKNLEVEPIWLNEEKKIPITSVRCMTGLSDLVPLHKSFNGNTYPKNIAPENSVSLDYVSTRNNHHIGIYESPDGSLKEIAVSLWEAVERKKAGLPVIIHRPDQVWDKVLNSGLDDQGMLSNLPGQDWKLVNTVQQNEMFVFRMSEEEIQSSIVDGTYHKISENLYRVQKIAEGDYVFRHHLETKLEKDSKEAKIFAEMGKFKRISSLSAFKKENPIKVRVDAKGSIQIVEKR